MPAVLTIPRPVLEAVIAHARAEYPKECCGLLAGSAGRVIRHHPLVNELQSPTAYRSEPRSMLAAMKAMRAEGTDLMAIYHSHPSSGPVPSERDLAENEYGETIYVIIGLAGPEPEVRAWRLWAGTVAEVAISVAARLPPELPPLAGRAETHCASSEVNG